MKYIYLKGLFCITPNDFEGSKATLQVASMLQNIQNFPLVHTDMVDGLVRRVDFNYLTHQNLISFDVTLLKLGTFAMKLKVES